MKQKTLLLFQLFLAVFALYSVFKYSGVLRLTAPLLALCGMFVVGKVELILLQQDRQKDSDEEEAVIEDSPKEEFKPIDCLLRSKNVLLLTDAIHHLFKELGLAVSRSPDQREIDRLIRAPEDPVTIGMKILGDISELNENWSNWDELSDFDLGKGGERRLLLVASNSTTEQQNGKPKFNDFSDEAQKLLSSKQVVAMTTLTVYKIYLLCTKKNVVPQKILRLIQKHPGGVFRLETYMKQPNKAA
jgi:hypothetical protein